jgi:hypothetical protein
LLDSFINNSLDRYMFVNVINIIVHPGHIVKGAITPYRRLGPMQHDDSHLPWIVLEGNNSKQAELAGDGKYIRIIITTGDNINTPPCRTRSR